VVSTHNSDDGRPVLHREQQGIIVVYGKGEEECQQDGSHRVGTFVVGGSLIASNGEDIWHCGVANAREPGAPTTSSHHNATHA
jgi:hypothetical protein